MSSTSQIGLQTAAAGKQITKGYTKGSQKVLQNLADLHSDPAPFYIRMKGHKFVI